MYPRIDVLCVRACVYHMNACDLVSDGPPKHSIDNQYSYIHNESINTINDIIVIYHKVHMI